GGAYTGSAWLPASVVTTGTHSFTGTGFSASALDFTAGEQAALPVEMTFFSASLQEANNVILQWSTVTEVDNQGFEIERRVEHSSVWTKVGFVSGSGMSNSPKDYCYQDVDLAPGLYSYRLKQIDNAGNYRYSGASQVDVGSSKGFELLCNYPNPFNPETKITFSVPENGYATLKVFNMLGQEVATLFSGSADAGHFISRTFDGSRFASGVYFSSLEYAGKKIIQRMMLTK
ncbi:MAG: T9SS type A sorting domain-containing protein, partial [Bacteroidota bacterium]